MTWTTGGADNPYPLIKGRALSPPLIKGVEVQKNTVKQVVLDTPYPLN